MKRWLFLQSRSTQYNDLLNLCCNYLCANYFAKCAINLFRNINSIGITWLIHTPRRVEQDPQKQLSKNTIRKIWPKPPTPMQ